MRLKEIHIDILTKVHLLGNHIPENKLIFNSEEQNAVKDLIANQYLGRFPNNNKNWLFAHSNPITNQYDFLKKTLTSLNIQL